MFFLFLTKYFLQNTNNVILFTQFLANAFAILSSLKSRIFPLLSQSVFHSSRTADRLEEKAKLITKSANRLFDDMPLINVHVFHFHII